MPENRIEPSVAPVLADVATYPPERFTGAEGLIASPPCPDWPTEHDLGLIANTYNHTDPTDGATTMTLNTDGTRTYLHADTLGDIQ